MCKKCGSKIFSGESYFNDDENSLLYSYYNYKDVAIIKVIEYIAKEISSNIKECSCCSVAEDMVTSINQFFNEEDDDAEAIINNINTSISLKELIFNYFGIDSNVRIFKDIIENIHCPCGYGSGTNYRDHTDNEYFDEYSEVYTKEELDKFYEQFDEKISEAKREISILASKVTLGELIELKNEYIQNRIYMSRNCVFCKLEELINDLFSKEFKYELAQNRIIFRTRGMDIGSSVEKNDLWEPPIGVSGHGRFNEVGSSVLYCANDISVLKKEVFINSGQEYIFAKFIINKPLKFFLINNIFGNDGDFNGLINESADSNDKKLKEQYIISNIVSAICYKVGYNGIVYKSIKDSSYINYAIFNFKKYEDIDMLGIFL